MGSIPSPSAFIHTTNKVANIPEGSILCVEERVCGRAETTRRRRQAPLNEILCACKITAAVCGGSTNGSEWRNLLHGVNPEQSSIPRSVLLRVPLVRAYSVRKKSFIHYHTDEHLERMNFKVHVRTDELARPDRDVSWSIIFIDPLNSMEEVVVGQVDFESRVILQNIFNTVWVVGIWLTCQSASNLKCSSKATHKVVSMFPLQRSPLHLAASTHSLSRTQLPQLSHIISQIFLKYLIKW